MVNPRHQQPLVAVAVPRAICGQRLPPRRRRPQGTQTAAENSHTRKLPYSIPTSNSTRANADPSKYQQQKDNDKRRVAVAKCPHLLRPPTPPKRDSDRSKTYVTDLLNMPTDVATLGPYVLCCISTTVAAPTLALGQRVGRPLLRRRSWSTKSAVGGARVLLASPCTLPIAVGRRRALNLLMTAATFCPA